MQNEKNVIKHQQNNFKDSKFYKKLISKHALCQANFKDNNVDVGALEANAHEELEQFDPKNPIEMMLVNQMLATHSLQQKMTTYANNFSNLPNQQQTYINASIKLSNLFVSQIACLSKLKSAGQSVTIKDVHIHDGGQAVVGTINCYEADNEKQK